MGYDIPADHHSSAPTQEVSHKPLPDPVKLPINGTYSHYYKDVSKLDTIDVYRVLSLFNVTDPCIQHAVKKLLVAGGRGAGKDISQDIKEAVDSLERWQKMRQEDNVTREYYVDYAPHPYTQHKIPPGKNFSGTITSHSLNEDDAIKDAKFVFEAQYGVDSNLYSWSASLS